MKTIQAAALFALAIASALAGDNAIRSAPDQSARAPEEPAKSEGYIGMTEIDPDAFRESWSIQIMRVYRIELTPRESARSDKPNI